MWKGVEKMNDKEKVVRELNKATSELVNHPAHYTQGSMETIEKIELLLTEEEYIGFLKGNIIKYDDRMNHKGDAENDLRKSKWYAERLRKTYYGGTNPND